MNQLQHSAHRVLTTAWTTLVIAGSAAVTILAGVGSPRAFICAGLVALLAAAIVRRSRRADNRADRARRDLTQVRRERDQSRLMLANLPGVVWSSAQDFERVVHGRRFDAPPNADARQRETCDWLELVHPKDRTAVEGAQRTACARRRGYAVEYRIRAFDGAWTWVLDKAQPLVDDVGAVTGFAGLAIEIKSIKQRDAVRLMQLDEAARSAERLQSEINELAEEHRELQDRLDVMRHADELKSHFLQAFNADLTRPIEEIRDTIGMMGTVDALDRQEQDLDRLKQATDSVCALLGRSVELTDVTPASSEEMIVEVDLRALLRDMEQQFGEQCGEDHHDAFMRIAGDVPVMVEMPPDLARSVLKDLWAAARRLGGDEDLRLSIECERRTNDETNLRFRIMTPGEQACDDLIERAFYPQEPIGSGAPGLGLGVARRRAENAGGRIGVLRTDEGEVDIWFTLPIKELNPSWDGRRAHGRFMQESVRSTLGEVIDFSLGGVRLRCKNVPAEQVDLEISDDEETLTMRAEVAWSKRLGIRKHEVGLRFVNLSPELAQRVSRLAIRNRSRRVMDAA
jgi:signal transduction histidine kinase